MVNKQNTGSFFIYLIIQTTIAQCNGAAPPTPPTPPPLSLETLKPTPVTEDEGLTSGNNMSPSAILGVSNVVTSLYSMPEETKKSVCTFIQNLASLSDAPPKPKETKSDTTKTSDSYTIMNAFFNNIGVDQETLERATDALTTKVCERAQVALKGRPGDLITIARVSYSAFGTLFFLIRLLVFFQFSAIMPLLAMTAFTYMLSQSKADSNVKDIGGAITVEILAYDSKVQLFCFVYLNGEKLKYNAGNLKNIAISAGNAAAAMYNWVSTLAVVQSAVSSANTYAEQNYPKTTSAVKTVWRYAGYAANWLTSSSPKEDLVITIKKVERLD